MNINNLLFIAAGYLCGAIPVAYVVGKQRGIDIRTIGSGNVGATNALRSMGTSAGAMVLLLDIAKVLVVLVVGQLLQLSREVLLLGGLAAFLGHIWPVYLKFKGGKGVAVAAGILMFFFPLPGLISITLFVVVAALTRYVSLASLSAAISVPLLLPVFNYHNLEVAYTGAIVMLIVWGHRANIVRLIQGNENKLSFRRG